jgi:hypothetical protein
MALAYRPDKHPTLTGAVRGRTSATLENVKSTACRHAFIPQSFGYEF